MTHLDLKPHYHVTKKEYIKNQKRSKMRFL